MELKYLVQEWTEAQIVVRADDRPIDSAAHAHLLASGAHFDVGLGGFVLEAGGMPWSFSAFLPAHQLTVRRVSVPYNPAWYGKRSAYPKFDELPLVFDGFPPNGGASCVTYWFVRRADNQPFMSTWYEGSWRTPNGQTSPADTVSEGWQMIASLRESLEMSYVMIDEANAGQASHGELNAIVDDTAGLSALRVALEAKRLRH